MSSVRLWTTMFVLFGFVALAIAAGCAWYARSTAKEAVVAPGEVIALNHGPRHVSVRVLPKSGTPFVYDENSSSAPLQVGQKILVRYVPSNPGSSAVVASRGIYSTAISFVLLALGFWLAALISPPLVRRFPNVLAFPIR